ncbi:MAG: KH domain-containing protein [Atopococcus tabaci]|uniref:RNA-binding protein KhpA n=1 Tax=Atopococcus tabaci TaxID=269774 RepID=A0AA43UBP6_9LACT|nr:KH domain-containing protein [Atopococcus tabaci]
MEKMETFIHTLVSPLVSRPEDISIQMEETDEFYDYHLSVHPEDVGRVIGKKGRIAKAMRTILYSIQIDAPKRVRLTIDD